jgi:hypothetical protein
MLKRRGAVAGALGKLTNIGVRENCYPDPYPDRWGETERQTVEVRKVVTESETNAKRRR